ncbi:MAG: Uma2 family endonuclease [Planctomycetaceae bacterium]
MIDVAPRTAEDFANWDDDCGEGRRWSELVSGKIIRHSPPDPEHGRIVLNLSKAIALHVQNTVDAADGYACFELGLIIARNPDTVRCPAISYFTSGPRFAELEKVVTETRPALVVEVASSADRRKGATERVESYLNWGVQLVWMADPVEKQVHVLPRGKQPRLLGMTHTLEGAPAIPGFRMPVAEVFAQPSP